MFSGGKDVVFLKPQCIQSSVRKLLRLVLTLFPRFLHLQALNPTAIEIAVLFPW